MKLDLHYVDPRLVALYDAANPRGADTAFYLRLADRLAAQVIVDLGCGTGLLTRALAREGAGAERVEWIAGDSSVLEDWGADLAVMTGNVAQVFVDDEAWLTTADREPSAVVVEWEERAMGRLIYSMIQSLDGYTEDAQGDFSWGAPDAALHTS